MRRSTIGFVFIFWCSGLLAQSAVPGSVPMAGADTIPHRIPALQFGFSRELRFAQYLQDKDNLMEAIRVLEELDTSGIPVSQQDSLFYMLGWATYSAKQLERSSSYLVRVSPEFALYNKSRFFSAYNKAFLGSTDTASLLLRQLTLPDSLIRELRSLQLAGIALLKKDFAGYRQERQHFTYTSYVYTREEQHMEIYYNRLKAFKRRSPVLAGLYSALVPGLGKFYAGKKKQAIAAFLPIISLAALTYEAYRKDGVKSARFIGFGAIFSIFYIGNIWGSTLAVKIRRNEFNKEYENKILFDMHIPLRNFFN